LENLLRTQWPVSLLEDLPNRLTLACVTIHGTPNRKSLHDEDTSSCLTVEILSRWQRSCQYGSGSIPMARHSFPVLLHRAAFVIMILYYHDYAMAIPCVVSDVTMSS
jgi:hypothetical protein